MEWEMFGVITIVTIILVSFLIIASRVYLDYKYNRGTEKFRLALIETVRTMVIARLGIDELVFLGMINDKLRHAYGLSSYEHWEEMSMEELVKVLRAYGR